MDDVKLNRPAEFANQFIRLCMRQGFQSLGKRDLELLIFLLLERDGAVNHSDSNFDVARRLRLTVNRVKLLRRDAYARWRPLLDETPEDAIRRICSSMFTKRALEAGARHVSEKRKDEGFIAVRVEHPDDLAQFEQAIIDVGAIPVYERNREVLDVRFDTLLRISEKHEFLGDDPKKVRAELEKLAPAAEEVAALLKKNVADLTMSDIRSTLNSLGAKVVSGLVEVKLRDLLKILFPFL